MTPIWDYKEKIHKQLCEEIHDLYVRKNGDYGNAFEKSYNKYGLQSVAIRLSDKLNRFENLINANQLLVKDESIDDTLIDLANYALLALVERRYEAGSFDCYSFGTTNTNTETKEEHKCENNCEHCTCEDKEAEKGMEQTQEDEIINLYQAIQDYYAQATQTAEAKNNNDKKEEKISKKKPVENKDKKTYNYSYSCHLDNDGNLHYHINDDGEEKDFVKKGKDLFTSLDNGTFWSF